MTFAHKIRSPDGEFGVYIAQPSAPNGAALVVIQEIFGVNGVMRAFADYYATLGYVAIASGVSAISAGYRRSHRRRAWFKICFFWRSSGVEE